jgi:cobalt-precorrin 5A hydrolase/precorrin-3B C17-methyltransferase
VSDAYRPGQRVVIDTLADFDTAAVTMTTLVIVGSSQTRIVEGRMVTPRGYVLAQAAR